jgi:serine phosphatase RsbU (regulator of sigma subunit)
VRAGLPGELEGARQVQHGLFPRQLPHVPGWEFAALCRPARVVAGDYHDLFALAPGRLAVVLGDVSGKGLGPALVMEGLHALVRCRLPERAADLGGFLTELNGYLLATLPEWMFVMLFLSVLDVGTGRLGYANAGHPAPLLLPGREEDPLELAEGGTVLGILPEADYRVGRAYLRPGSLMVLFSDGLTEARDGGGQMFRKWRVAELLHGAWGWPATSVAGQLLAGVERFTAGAEQPTTSP